MLKLPFTGCPKPKAVWTHQGNDLRTGSRVQTELKERHAVLTLNDVDKSLAGRFLGIEIVHFIFITIKPRLHFFFSPIRRVHAETGE